MWDISNHIFDNDSLLQTIEGFDANKDLSQKNLLTIITNSPDWEEETTPGNPLASLKFWLQVQLLIKLSESLVSGWVTKASPESIIEPYLRDSTIESIDDTQFSAGDELKTLEDRVAKGHAILEESVEIKSPPKKIIVDNEIKEVKEEIDEDTSILRTPQEYSRHPSMVHSEKTPSPDHSTKNPESPPSYRHIEPSPEPKASLVPEVEIDIACQDSHEKSSTTSSPDQVQIGIFDSPEFAFVAEKYETASSQDVLKELTSLAIQSVKDIKYDSLQEFNSL